MRERGCRWGLRAWQAASLENMAGEVAGVHVGRIKVDLNIRYPERQDEVWESLKIQEKEYWHEEVLSIPVSTPFLRATAESTSIMGTDWNNHLPSRRPLSTGLPVRARGPPEACSSFFPPFTPHSIFVFPSQITASCPTFPHWVFPALPLPCPEQKYHNSDKKLWAILSELTPPVISANTLS